MTEYHAMNERPQEPRAAAPFHRFEAPDGATWTEFHRRGDAYLLRFPGYADFDVSADGTHITSHPAPGVDAVTVEHLYINQVLPLALSRQGRLAYHASAVATNGGAIAFLGRTGQGKSTLAAQFATAGARFLTDDGLVLMDTLEGMEVQPSRPSIRLWDDSREALLTKGLTLGPAVSFTSKSRVLAGDELPYCDEPRRLLAAYLLEGPGADEVVITRASAAESVLGWIANSFLLDVEDRALVTRHFDNATRVAATVPTFRLDYPRRYDALPKVQAALERHVSRSAR